MVIPCAVLVHFWRQPRNRGQGSLSRTPVTHRPGGGATLHPVYTHLHYNPSTREVLLVADSDFLAHLPAQRTLAKHVVAALLATEGTGVANGASPSALPSIAEGGRAKGPS